MTTYWLDLFSPETWTAFLDSDRSVSGFRKAQRGEARKLREGDRLICYVTVVSRWSGILQIKSHVFDDETPIFERFNDPFSIRVKVDPLVVLPLERSVPIAETWEALSITLGVKAGSNGWAQRVGIRRSLKEISESDGDSISRALEEQARNPRPFPLPAPFQRDPRGTVDRSSHSREGAFPRQGE